MNVLEWLILVQFDSLSPASRLGDHHGVQYIRSIVCDIRVTVCFVRLES